MTDRIRTTILVSVSTLALGAQTVNGKPATAAQHGEVSKRYALCAEQLDLAARKNYYAMTHKYPALIQGPIDREKGLAGEARRAAEESLNLAAKHGQAALQFGARGNGCRQGL